MTQGHEPFAQRDRRPLSTQVYARLREQIRDGRYGSGGKLPSEQELSGLFGVSRVTVREAIRMLQRDLLVESRHGRGHYVLGNPTLVKAPITQLQGVTDLMYGLGYSVETEVVGVDTRPAGNVASQLELEPSDHVIYLERLRASQGTPMIYSVDVFPARFAGHADIDWSGSLLEVLERANVRIAYSQATIRAVTLDRAIARRARVSHTLPWVLLEQLNYTIEHRPVLYSLDYHRGDKFEFQTLRTRDEPVRGLS